MSEESLPHRQAAAWQPGWVPQGWKRGEDLWVVPAKPGCYGSVCPELEFNNVRADMVVVQFHHDDGPRVQAWLEWWNGTDDAGLS